MKEILLCLEPTTPSVAHVKAAAWAAALQNARLTVLFVQPVRDIPLAVRLQMEDVEKVLAESDREIADRARRLTAEAVQPAGVAYQWVEAAGLAEEILVRRSRTSDLVVVASPSREGNRASDEPMPDPLIGPLVMHSGRPVLVVPADAAITSFGRRIAVCWDGGRESSRALHDALPILQKADSVSLLMVVQKLSESGGPPIEFGAAARSHLAQYGVSAEAQAITLRDGRGVDDLLLDQAGNIAADLVVMGAFGRSRLREIVLGSVTNGVISRSRIPVLLSH